MTSEFWRIQRRICRRTLFDSFIHDQGARNKKPTHQRWVGCLQVHERSENRRIFDYGSATVFSVGGWPWVWMMTTAR